MSDVVGPIAVGDREAEIFLGREVVQRREISDRTAEIVDTELKRILSEAYERARTIVTDHRAALDRLASALLERETLDRDEVELVVAGRPLPPVPPPAPATPQLAPAGLERLGPDLGRLLAAQAEPPQAWEIAGQRLALDHPVIVGIINVTPDSFSDGGRFVTVDRAIAQAERLIADGCELLDVGGESTRPGAAPVALDDEIARVVPVIEQLARRRLGPISVDTRKAPVARAAIPAGAPRWNAPPAERWGLGTAPRPSRAPSRGSGGRGCFGSTTPPWRVRRCAWRVPPRAHGELRSLPLPHPALLAGRRRDRPGRVRDLPLPAVPRGNPGDADRGGRDDPLGRVLRGAARQVPDDQLPVERRLHLRRVPGRGGVPARAAQRAGASRPVASDAPLLAGRSPVGGRGDRRGDGPAGTRGDGGDRGRGRRRRARGVHLLGRADGSEGVGGPADHHLHAVLAAARWSGARARCSLHLEV